MLGDRPEISKAFDEIKGSKSRNYVTVDQVYLKYVFSILIRPDRIGFNVSLVEELIK